jgi:hypothetical protein
VRYRRRESVRSSSSASAPGSRSVPCRGRRRSGPQHPRSPPRCRTRRRAAQASPTEPVVATSILTACAVAAAAPSTRCSAEIPATAAARSSPGAAAQRHRHWVTARCSAMEQALTSRHWATRTEPTTALRSRQGQAPTNRYWVTGPASHRGWTSPSVEPMPAARHSSSRTRANRWWRALRAWVAAPSSHSRAASAAHLSHRPRAEPAA